MAIAGAAACLAHCIALPVVIAALPALATVVPIPTTFHIIALSFAVPTTLFALLLGFRHHRALQPLFAGLIGLALLAIGVLAYGETPAEVPLTIAGSVAIVTAHVGNWLRRRNCAC